MCGNVLRKYFWPVHFLLTIFFTIELFAQDFSIRSLRYYGSKEQSGFPIIVKGDPDKSNLNIEFDLLCDTQPNLNIIFRFCDSNGMPYENAFLTNPGYNTEYNLYYERLPSTITGAKYHFKGSFPNQNVTFPFSGRWKFLIVDSFDKNKIYANGDFFVVDPFVKLNTSIYKERMEGLNPDEPSLGRTISIKTSFVLPDSLFQSKLKKVMVFENQKLFNPIVIDRMTQSNNRFYEWNGSNNFSFTARQLLPGNEYRQTDFRNVNRFMPGTINAQFEGIETSDYFKRRVADFNGGMILSDFRDRNSDYLTVNFKLRVPESITSSIFLVGSFTNWLVLPEYEMFDDNGLMNLAVQLKRGAYDYQYVTGDYINGQIQNVNWQILEGNFWETKNEYHIFLFYESTEKGGYDQIIGYKKIYSGEKWAK